MNLRGSAGVKPPQCREKDLETLSGYQSSPRAASIEPWKLEEYQGTLSQALCLKWICAGNRSLTNLYFSVPVSGNSVIIALPTMGLNSVFCLFAEV